MSINGANRLGANSTAECLVWGRITGAAAAEYARQRSERPAGRGPGAEGGEAHLRRDLPWQGWDEPIRGEGPAPERRWTRAPSSIRTGEGLAEAIKVGEGAQAERLPALRRHAAGDTTRTSPTSSRSRHAAGGRGVPRRSALARTRDQGRAREEGLSQEGRRELAEAQPRVYHERDRGSAGWTTRRSR